MSPSIHVGPPYSNFEGMVTKDRRQQINPNTFRTLRNIRISQGALRRRKGMVRLFSGAASTTCLKNGGTGADYCTIPQEDPSGTDVPDYDLGLNWTVFVSYKLSSLAADTLVIQDGTVAPSWYIKHEASGTITAEIYDTGSGICTMSSSGTFTRIGTEYQVVMHRTGGTASLYVNGVSQASGTGLGSTRSTKAGQNIYLAGYVASPYVSDITYYEVRLFRSYQSSDTWRVTQYPWSGLFGHPDLILHLTFENGSGTTVTDHSRVGNDSIALAGTWTWPTTSTRQVVTPVTGIEIFENSDGRKWLVACIGVNYYRIPLN